MEKEALYEQIEAYLHNEMNEAQKKDFEFQISQNPELQKEIALHNDLERELASDVLQLRKTLKEITTENKGKTNLTIRSAKFYKLLYQFTAVAAIFILGIIFLPRILNPSTDINALYEKHYESYPMALNQRSNDGTSETLDLNAAINLYINQNFREAALGFEKLYRDEQNTIYALYQAHALMADNEFEKAIEIYDMILGTSETTLYEQCIWYKGLALLKLNKKEEVIDLFSQTLPTHYKNDEIQQILKRLK